MDKCENDNILGKHTFFDNYVMHIFLFIAAIISIIVTLVIVHVVCKHVKLKVLVTGIAFQPLKGTDALINGINDNEDCTCKA